MLIKTFKNKPVTQLIPYQVNLTPQVLGLARVLRVLELCSHRAVSAQVATWPRNTVG